MPLKGKYGTYRKHCSSCVYVFGGRYKEKITCYKHCRQFFSSHCCDDHLDVRSNKGKEVMKQLWLRNKAMEEQL